MVLKIALTILAVVVVLVAVIAARPAAFRVARSTIIAAPADVVFAQLNDFHRWLAWSPYEKIDPAMTRSFEGPGAGVGAVYQYAGDRKVGKGRLTLIESQPNRRVAIRAEFLEPFVATNLIELTLEPRAEGVAVTWAMSGNNTFIFKAFSLLVNVDRMVGGEFERGLADLKRVSEEEASRHATDRVGLAQPRSI